MITGVAQADVGVLVISARKGEFEAGFERSGQTREHALLAKTLGVKKLIIVINKMDEPTVEWSKERFDGIQSKLGAYLKSVCINTCPPLFFFFERHNLICNRLATTKLRTLYGFLCLVSLVPTSRTTLSLVCALGGGLY